jgi:hypothetical protein
LPGKLVSASNKNNDAAVFAAIPQDLHFQHGLFQQQAHGDVLLFEFSTVVFLNHRPQTISGHYKGPEISAMKKFD